MQTRLQCRDSKYWGSGFIEVVVTVTTVTVTVTMS